MLCITFVRFSLFISNGKMAVSYFVGIFMHVDVG